MNNYPLIIKYSNNGIQALNYIILINNLSIPQFESQSDTFFFTLGDFTYIDDIVQGCVASVDRIPASTKETAHFKAGDGDGAKKCCENHGLTSNTWEVSWDLSYICLNMEMFFWVNKLQKWRWNGC